MLFNSFNFFFFFAVLGLLFDIIKKEQRWLLLLGASVIFILYTAPQSIFYFCATCLITYICTRVIDDLDRSKEDYKRCAEVLITIDIVINIGILFLTKYLGFFEEIFCGLLRREYRPISLIVPLGISFYTFMMVGYAIDVYRKDCQAQRNILKLFLFATYFPQLVNGPISRYGDISESLFNPPDIEYTRCRDALVLFAWGLFKKVCVADNVLPYVNMIYNDYSNYYGLIAFSGAVAYALFIYADFSGCIDMARGVSRYLGIELKANFEYPYFSTSVEEFWRRWHITLGTWYRDYLFYPILKSSPMINLNRKLRGVGLKKFSAILPTSVALLIVWLFTGLWHGARTTYIVWGLYYGVLIILSSVFRVFKNRKKEHIKPIKILCTFVLVCFGYIIFNSTSLYNAFAMIRNVFSLNILDFGELKVLGISYYKQVGASIYFGITVISCVLLVLVDYLSFKGKRIYNWILAKNRITKYVICVVFVFILFFMINRSSGDFTYMQF